MFDFPDPVRLYPTRTDAVLEFLFIFPFPFIGSFDHNIEIKVEGIKPKMRAAEGELEVDVIAHKLVRGCIPDVNCGIEFFWFKQNQKAVGMPEIFLQLQSVRESLCPAVPV